MFNANDYFNKRNQISASHPNRPGRLKSNSFSGIISGPVVIPHIYDGHNKTFFTFDMQDTDYTAQAAYTGTVPTATMQSSGFTSLVDTLNLSTTKYTDGLGRQFQAGTVIDRPRRARFFAVQTIPSPASIRSLAAHPAHPESSQIPVSTAARRPLSFAILTSRNWVSLRDAPALRQRRTGFRRWQAVQLPLPASINFLQGVLTRTRSHCSSCFRKSTTMSESIRLPD